MNYEDFIRVDDSASKTNGKLEPAAAGTSNDSSLLSRFLHDLFHEKNDMKKTNDSKMIEDERLYALLNNIFGKNV